MRVSVMRMRAIRLIQPGSPLVEVEQEPVSLNPGEVRVQVAAAGICRSDVHYRAGTRPVPRLPVTPGHEVAGVVSETGSEVTDLAPGDRVVLHYLVSCGQCGACRAGREQFCSEGAMIGLSRDGGYAEEIVVPARNAIPLPDSIPMEIGAVMMCSTATSLHALRRGGFEPGETVAVFGCGGLGMSAIKLAVAMGAGGVYAIDIDPTKLEAAAGLGATPVLFDDASTVVADVALELVGLPETMAAAVGSLAVGGRAVAVGITHEPFALHSFNDLVLREASVVGSADHLLSEIHELISMSVDGVLDLSDVVTGTVPLEANAVNAAMDALQRHEGGIRSVIVP